MNSDPTTDNAARLEAVVRAWRATPPAVSQEGTMNVKVEAKTHETIATATMVGVRFGPDRKEPSARVVLGGSMWLTAVQHMELERNAADLAIKACEANARALALAFPGEAP